MSENIAMVSEETPPVPCEECLGTSNHHHGCSRNEGKASVTVAPVCHHCLKDLTGQSFACNCGLISCDECVGCEHNRRIGEGKRGPRGPMGLPGEASGKTGTCSVCGIDRLEYQREVDLFQRDGVWTAPQCLGNRAHTWIHSVTPTSSEPEPGQDQHHQEHR